MFIAVAHITVAATELAVPSQLDRATFSTVEIISEWTLQVQDHWALAVIDPHLRLGEIHVLNVNVAFKACLLLANIIAADLDDIGVLADFNAAWCCKYAAICASRADQI